MTKTAVVLLSGGIDSVTVMALLYHHQMTIHALVFDYGQTLAKEVPMACQAAARYGATVQVVTAPLAWMAPTCTILGQGTHITRGRSVADIKAGGTPTSYVPFRNGIFLAYAVGYGEARAIPHIYCGGNGLHSGNYPDDTDAFAKDFQRAARTGTAPTYRPRVIFPWANMPKAAIVRMGIVLGVDYTQTWSCYLNGDTHCGTCDSCVQRKAAMAANTRTIDGGIAQ